MTEPDQALFRRDGEWFDPSRLTTGPWRSDAMHGGPPAALIGRELVSMLDEGEHVARLTVDLVRPIPLVSLRVSATRQLVSRRVAHVSLALATADEDVATAHAVLLRGGALPEPAWRPPAEDLTVPGEQARFDFGADGRYADELVFHRDGVEHRVVGAGYGQPGPGVAWIRLSYPLVAGEPTPPLCGLLAAADFGSALSNSLPREGDAGLINVDVSIALARPPVGEWFRLDAVGLVSEVGIGLATARLTDAAGPLGVLHQSQLGHSRG